MSFDIPEPYVWDETFKVFYDNLDEEHKNLFVAVFKCAKSPACADTLAKLIDVTVNHFTDEEGMMKKANYDTFETHKAAHDEFVAKLKGLAVPLNDDAIHYAKNWLVQHIKGIDFKYKEKL